jgi:4-amino-4-deoxy-L-arabinose transferase-like glycosyltransferase
VAFDATACAIGGIVIFAVARFVYSTKRNKQKGEATDISGQKYSWFFTHSDAVFVLVILAFSTIFFINLGSGALWAADEQTYSQWAFHMVKSGDYLTPWAYGDLSFWISKPPLNMWLMSLSYQAFGVTNFASRLWSSIFGTLSLVVVYFLGKKLYNPYVGFASAIVLGTFTTFFAFARHAMTDLPFAFFVLASIYFFISSDKIGKTNRYAALSGVFFGLALMTKQVEALLIPLILFAYLLVTKKSIRFLFTKHFTLFWGIALLVFAPWLIYMNISFGSDFWQSYFMYGAVTRTVSPIEGHVGGYLFYFNYLVYNENPLWVILLPFAAGLCAFNSVIKRLKEDTLILLWMAIVLLVFTFAQTKLYWYILPAFPAFAIAISSFLYEVSKKIRARHRLTSSKSKAS